MSANACVDYELFGRVVAAHIEIPRQVMRRYKEVPPDQSISDFLGNLRDELRQGSLARIRFVRENREGIARQLESLEEDTPRMMMERAKLLLELARRESLGMVRMSNLMRDIRTKIAPIERDIENAGLSLKDRTAERIGQPEHLEELVDKLASTALQLEQELAQNTGLGLDKDPYKGTARLTDFLDLSETTLASVMPDMAGAAIDNQVSRFVRGVLNPRIGEIHSLGLFKSRG
ncbi:MAG: hypothetical protein AAGD43_26960 [Pseudomonadota bacterium]